MHLDLIISKIQTGRINKNTTINIGKISGGTAINIIPGKTTISCEIRGHSERIISNQLKKYKNFLIELRSSTKKQTKNSTSNSRNIEFTIRST